MNMSLTSGQASEESDDALLREAVAAVRNTSPPAEAAERAVQRAEQLLTAASSVQRTPVAATRSGRKWWVALAVCCGVLLMVAAGDALRTARQNRKLARQLQTSNSLKQIGLAMHNYLDMGPAGLAYGTNTRPVDYFLANNGVVNPTVRFAQSRPMVAHSASIVLVVSKIDEAESQLNDLLSQLDGTISHAEVTEPQGQPRTASWVVRVPSESLHDFLQKVANFGTPENRIVNSQDVGDEYVDLQARIATKRELEKRILKLLEEQTGDLPEVLKVEEQLARIREEIERMEGRIQHLDSVTAMSTVKVSAREEQNYVPPQAPTFSGEIDQTWQDSLELLEDLGKALVICVIAIVPWLPLLLIPVLVIRLWLKRRRATAEE